MPYYFDWTYLLVLAGVVLSLLASAKVKSTYKKYSKVRSMNGMTGAQAAEQILHANEIYDVRIEAIDGNLTDHYDPSAKTLCLSEGVYSNLSVAALGIAAHECGHAIQHAQGYAPLKIRTAIVPVANFGAKLSWPLILLGLVLGSSGSQMLINIGILMFSFSVLFQLVTLPVEFNASARAVAALENMGILYGEEVGGTKKVLKAAALTYVAAAAASILQLLRLVLLFGRRDD